jgi:hypothetical protein
MTSIRKNKILPSLPEKNKRRRRIQREREKYCRQYNVV